MPKTKMNNSHREVLKNFCNDKIIAGIDQKTKNRLYKRLVNLTNTAIRKKYPESDMEILRKYGLALVDRCIKYQFPSGRVDGFTFKYQNEKSEDFDISLEITGVPYKRGCGGSDVFAVSDEFESILSEYTKLIDENSKSIDKKMRDCNSLIISAKYVEDVLEIIKVPKELKERLLGRSTAIVAISPEVTNRIKEIFN